jgi:hypothetical protein
MSDWPTCDSLGTVIGWEFRCILPRGHEMDGTSVHENVEGVRWTTEKMTDGRTIAISVKPSLGWFKR